MLYHILLLRQRGVYFAEAVGSCFLVGFHLVWLSSPFSVWCWRRGTLAAKESQYGTKLPSLSLQRYNLMTAIIMIHNIDRDNAAADDDNS